MNLLCLFNNPFRLLQENEGQTKQRGRTSCWVINNNKEKSNEENEEEV